jgi:hypothetical protein
LYQEPETKKGTYAFQAHSAAKFTGNHTDIIREEGFYDLGFEAVSYAWHNNGTDTCITWCLNLTTASGWQCDYRNRSETDEPFSRVFIWPGRGQNEGNKKKCQPANAQATSTSTSFTEIGARELLSRWVGF